MGGGRAGDTPPSLFGSGYQCAEQHFSKKKNKKKRVFKKKNRIRRKKSTRKMNNFYMPPKSAPNLHEFPFFLLKKNSRAFPIFYFQKFAWISSFLLKQKSREFPIFLEKKLHEFPMFYYKKLCELIILTKNSCEFPILD